MKESHWRAMSLGLTTALILVVASWASAQSRSKAAAADPSEDVSTTNDRVIIERDRRRYVLAIHATNTETDKYILYDSWDVAQTHDIWFLEDPHKVKSLWKRIPFAKK